MVLSLKGTVRVGKGRNEGHVGSEGNLEADRGRKAERWRI